MTDRDMEQLAKVSWHSEPAPAGKIRGADTQLFGELADAVRFVMEEIPAWVRWSAWIMADGARISLPEIEKLYASHRK